MNEKVISSLPSKIIASDVIVGTPKRIAGVVVLGKGNINLEDEPDKTAREGGLWAQYVSHYTVEYSPDGRLWTEIMDDQGQPRVSNARSPFEQEKWR
jgi:hypothetical protein